MTWHVSFYDDATETAYRVRVKRLTVGDAIAMDQLADDIARREVEGRLLLALTMQYPFVRYATAAAQRAACAPEQVTDNSNGDPILPDDIDWQSFEIDEETFLALPEYLAMRCQHEVIMLNPHRNPAYELLKKKRLAEQLRQPSENDTEKSSTGEKDAVSPSGSG